MRELDISVNVRPFGISAAAFAAGARVIIKMRGGEQVSRGRRDVEGHAGLARDDPDPRAVDREDERVEARVDQLLLAAVVGEVDAVGGDIDQHVRVDLLRVLDHVEDLRVREGLADPDRLGISGISYGGYLTARTITQTTRFRASALVSGISTLNSSPPSRANRSCARK